MVHVQAGCSEIVTHWFNQCLKVTLEKLDLVGKADRIFNVNESGSIKLEPENDLMQLMASRKQ